MVVIRHTVICVQARSASQAKQSLLASEQARDVLLPCTKQLNQVVPMLFTRSAQLRVVEKLTNSCASSSPGTPAIAFLTVSCVPSAQVLHVEPSRSWHPKSHAPPRQCFRAGPTSSIKRTPELASGLGGRLLPAKEQPD